MLRLDCHRVDETTSAVLTDETVDVVTLWDQEGARPRDLLRLRRRALMDERQGHRVRDVAVNEDAITTRIGTSSEVLPASRNRVLSLLHG